MPATIPKTAALLDIENELAGPNASARQIQEWFAMYRREAVGVRPGDMVIVGASHHMAKTAMFALAGQPIQWRLGSGPDGAENAILASIDIEWMAKRYERLVIGSRDAAFAPVAVRARALGMHVQLVVTDGWIKRELRDACPTRTRIRSVRRLRPAGSRPLFPAR